jgi:hypothetical protein
MAKPTPADVPATSRKKRHLRLTLEIT